MRTDADRIGFCDDSGPIGRHEMVENQRGSGLAKDRVLAVMPAVMVAVFVASIAVAARCSRTPPRRVVIQGELSLDQCLDILKNESREDLRMTAAAQATLWIESALDEIAAARTYSEALQRDEILKRIRDKARVR